MIEYDMYYFNKEKLIGIIIPSNYKLKNESYALHNIRGILK